MAKPKTLKRPDRPLPGICPQSCPCCDRPAWLLGQYDPTSERSWICKQCSEAYRYPVEMLEGNITGDWKLKKDVTREQLNLRAENTAYVYDRVIKRNKRSLIKHYEYLMTGVMSFIADLPEELQRYWERQLRRTHQINVKRSNAKLSPTIQMTMPLCVRCGNVHNRRFYDGHGDYFSRCQHCDDEFSVEAIFRHRGIFGNDDDETILDRIQKSHPQLFERGVLPDYWYELRIDEVKV